MDFFYRLIAAVLLCRLALLVVDGRAGLELGRTLDSLLSVNCWKLNYHLFLRLDKTYRLHFEDSDLQHQRYLKDEPKDEVPLGQHRQQQQKLEGEHEVGLETATLAERAYLKTSVIISSPASGTTFKKKIPFQGLYWCCVRCDSIMFMLMCTHTNDR